jgi:hypothetical protein
MFQQRDVSRVVSLTTEISNDIKDDYPFYADELQKIVNNTFRSMGGGFCGLNVAAFGEMFIITKHLHNEPQNTSVCVKDSLDCPPTAPSFCH